LGVASLALAAGACRSQSLTPERAAALLLRSAALSGVERMTFTTPRGCFTIAADSTFKAGDLDRDRRLSESPALRQQLQREQDLDLLDFEFSPVPAAVAAPPEGCEQLWASYHNAGPDTAARVKLVPWRTMMSDKALAAGLSPGLTVVLRRQTLVEVTRVIQDDANTSVVEYTWQWAPPYESAHLGIRSSEPTAATAIVKRSSGDWRVVVR
jgi:hypothetical protein